MTTKTIFNQLYTSKYFKNLPAFKQQRTQQFITIVLTLFAISFFGIFAIMPTLSTTANLQKQKEDNDFVEQKLDDKRSNLSQLSKEYESIQTDLPYVLNAIPKEPDIPELSGKLYALSKNTSVTIIRIQTFEVELGKKQEGPQKFSSFSFSIDVTGTYTDLLRYVESMTNFDRIITVDSLAITKSSDKDKTSTIKMSIKGKAYFKL